MTSSVSISIRNLHKSFGPKQVLRGINLDVKTNESLVIIGGSGSGKSVLLKSILGLIEPDQGEILIDGQNCLEMSRTDRENLMAKFGMLFQGGALFDSLLVWENVSFRPLVVEGMDRNEAKALAVETLNKVGLGAEVADLSPAELSGGMQKRVGLARAISSKPSIIFFDEPTTGLDPIMADVINDLIRKSVSDLGATALSITHDMASARKISDRVAMLYQGEIIWQGPSSDIDASGNDYVDQFVNGRAEGPIAMPVLKG
jgi:phospholipid/cholesterol/gamma-HCH transport system ATP-binding protein